MSSASFFKRRSNRSLPPLPQLYPRQAGADEHVSSETKSLLYGTPDRFPFMLLPPEIRIAIYSMLFTRAKPIHFAEKFYGNAGISYELEGDSPGYPTALLRTSHRIHDEATDILYGENLFCFLIGCRTNRGCCYIGPSRTDTFRASKIALNDARKIKRCIFSLYRLGWDDDARWMKRRVQDMARAIGGDHRWRKVIIQFTNTLNSRKRIRGVLNVDEADDQDLKEIKRHERQLLGPLKYIWGVGHVELLGVTSEYTSELKAAMEADELTVVKHEVSPTEAAEVKKRKANERRRKKGQRNYYRY